MPFTRLYVYPTTAPMSQARQKKFLCLLKQWSDKTRGHNSFLISIAPKDQNTSLQKDRKLSFKESENWIWRAFISTLCYHRSFPYPSLDVSSPSYPLQSPTSSSSLLYPPSPLVGIGPMVMMIIVTHTHPYFESVYNEGCDIMSGQEEGFVSHNYYESSSGYGIQSVWL